VYRRDPRFREPALHQQRAQQPRIGAVGLSALLRTPRYRDLGRITQMHAHPRAGYLFGDVPPPSATLQRELRVPIRAVLAQPRPQRLPRRRADLTPPNQPVVIHIVERDLLPMHVKPAYHRH
jgi:hypothetical protein